MSLKAFRAQHPEYNDVSDRDLADALYKKHYADVPRADYDRRMGLAPAPRGRPIRNQAADAAAARSRPASGAGSSAKDPVRLATSLRIGSPEYKAALSKIPRGAYYRDPQGNIRVNNSADGNRIVLTKAQVQKPKSGLDDFGKSLPTGVFEGVQGIIDQASPDELIAGTIGLVTGKPAARKEQRGFSPMDIIQSGANAASGLGQMIGGDQIGGRNALAAARESTPQGRAQQFGLDQNPTTLAGRGGRLVGNMLPNALAPQGAIPRTAAVLLPAGGGLLGGEVGMGMGGERGEAVGQVLGSLVGGLAAGARITRPPRRPVNRSIDAFQRRARQDPAEMAARAEEYRAAGIAPTLADVADDTGRGVIRATASRPTPAKQAANDFRDARAADLPDRISGQARRYISNDPRTPDAIREATTAQRSAQGREQFGAVRSEEVTLDPDTVMALRSPEGRTAIRTAASNAANSMDPDVRALASRLNQLADDALDNPGGTRVTVGMAQEISGALFDSADAARGPVGAASNRTRLFTQQAEAVRNNARSQVPGYDEALNNYAANSRLRDAAEVGEALPRANTDEFVASVRGMAPEELDLARAGARRSIERAVGESPSSAPAFARRFAVGQEPGARVNALIGDQRGAQFRNAIGLEERALQNANAIAPKTGSSTFNNLTGNALIDNAPELMGGARDAATGNWAGLGIRVVNYWRSRGISNEVAEDLTRLALSPEATDDALRYIQQRYGDQAARAFIEVRQDPAAMTLLAGSGAGSTNGLTQQQPQR
jgi:hypothetical protein